MSEVCFKVKLYDRPVITKDNPEVKGNQFGFETGTVVKVKSKYYMFVTLLCQLQANFEQSENVL